MHAADLTLVAARDAIARGDLCPVDYVDALLGRIAALDGRLHAFIAVDGDAARAAAQRLRDMRPKAALPPLFGVPFGIKDIIDVAGTVTTCHSRVTASVPARHNAAVVDRLIAAGGIPLGKLALSEFALGGPDFTAPWPPARNPWNTDYMPGSSSTGAGVAVAARMLPLALGTDTGGSIRSPAVMNGIVGLKPTFGCLPMDGIFPLAPSMDCVGPLARTVADVALAFSCLGGDARPSGGRPRIGLLDHLWRDDQVPDAGLAAVIDHAIADLGADLPRRSIAPLNVVNAVAWTTLYREAYAVHRETLQARPGDYGAPLRDQLLTGAFVTDNDYRRAEGLRAEITAQLDVALGGLDCLLTAVSGLPPCRLDDADAIKALGAASVRLLCNVTGHPAIALPVGLSDGLPIGIQLIGRKGAEGALLAAAAWAEARISGWSAEMRP